MLVYTLPANSSFTLINSYEQDTITFLQIWIKAKEPVYTISSQLYSFSINNIKNRLASIIPEANNNTEASEFPFSLSIGQFGGRQETVYKLCSKEALFFGFVITGAFELEGRLMHEKDGLALWDVEEVELEALSINALMLVVELYS
jgi:hypothetical protein